MPYDPTSRMDVRRLHAAGTTQRHVRWEAEVEMISGNSLTGSRFWFYEAVLTYYGTEQIVRI